MPEPRPELIFVAGPEAGRRAVLLKSPMVFGRTAACDVRLSEQFVSRQHLQMELTHDGWVLQNLSAAGTLINGKKYKRRKRILLDTGDVLGMGRETRLLFVAGGDDPERAIADYTAAHGQPGSAPSAGEQAPPSPEPDAAPAAPTAPVDVAKTPPPAESTDEEKKRKAKLRLYAILGAVWAVCFIGGFIALSLLSRDDGPGGDERPKYLHREIADALKEPIRRTRNATLAAEYLRKAEAGYENWLQPGSLSACVKNYKLHLAYSGKTFLEDSTHERHYDIALSKLIQKVRGEYQAAFAREKSRQWATAEEKWARLMEHTIRPDSEWDTQGYDDLAKNIVKHLSYVRKRAGTPRRR